MIKWAIETRHSEVVTCKTPDDLTFQPIVRGPILSSQSLSNTLDTVFKPLCIEVKNCMCDDLLLHPPSTIGVNVKLEYSCCR